STMFGVYVFIGFVQATSAAMILVARRLKKAGYLEVVTDDHFHDMGKYMFGFTVFWAYIGVSQYLLIWYANLPEETTFYLMRQTPGWVWVSMALPLVRFVLPFLLLLPRAAKRNSAYLEKVALLVVFGEWLDCNYLIMPAFSRSGFTFSWMDIGMFLGFLGFFAFAVRRFLSKNHTVPVNDPFLHETMHHHVM
ncbi:MAG: molybdopterin oxidoreductase, partial [Bdellovibrionota bacterium]